MDAFQFTLELKLGGAFVTDIDCQATLERNGSVTIEFWSPTKNGYVEAKDDDPVELGLCDRAIHFLYSDRYDGWTEYKNNMRMAWRAADRALAAE